jgi:hypothetical protein
LAHKVRKGHLVQLVIKVIEALLDHPATRVKKETRD